MTQEIDELIAKLNSAMAEESDEFLMTLQGVQAAAEAVLSHAAHHKPNTVEAARAAMEFAKDTGDRITAVNLRSAGVINVRGVPVAV